MSLKDHKITDAQVAQKGIVAAPDTLVGSAPENKKLFDRLVREVVKASINSLVDALTDPLAAAELGFAPTGELTAKTVQKAAEQLLGEIHSLQKNKIDKVTGGKAGNLAVIAAGGNVEDADTSLAALKQEVNAAQSAAKASADSAKRSETAAKTSESNAKLSEANAGTAAASAADSKNKAAASEKNAKASEEAAKDAAEAAKKSETVAGASEKNAKTSEDAAAASAEAAKQSQEAVKDSEDSAAASAREAQEAADRAELIADPERLVASKMDRENPTGEGSLNVGLENKVGERSAALGDHTEADWRSLAFGGYTRALNTGFAGGAFAQALAHAAFAMGAGDQGYYAYNGVDIKLAEEANVDGTVFVLNTEDHGLAVGDVINLRLKTDSANILVDSRYITAVDGATVTVNYKFNDLNMSGCPGSGLFPVGTRIRKVTPVVASAQAAVAMGKAVQSLAEAAVSMGKGTIASEIAQIVLGMFNVDDSTKAFILGAGTSDSDRKNIFTVDKDGNAEFLGTINGADLQAIKSLAEGAMPGFSGSIKSNEDMDDYVIPGAYKVGVTAVATLANRAFDGSHSFFVAECSAENSNGVTELIQLATFNSNKTPKLRFRRLASSDMGWSPWSDIYTSLNPPTAADVGALPTTGGIMTGKLSIWAQTDYCKQVAGEQQVGQVKISTVSGAPCFAHDLYIGSVWQSRLALLENGLELWTKDSNKFFAIYHEGNKPTPAEIGAAATATYNATVTTTWTASGSYFYQNITVSGILATDNPIVDIKSSSDNAANVQYSEGICKIFRITTAANKITVWATEKPSVAIPIQLKVVR